MSKLITHEVLRPICIAGERIEVGGMVDLGPVLGAELRHAGKVRKLEASAQLADLVVPAAKDAADPTKAVEPSPRVKTPKPAPPSTAA